MSNPKEDKKLIKNLKKGDREAFDMLYNKYWKPLFNTAYKRINFKEPTEEIIQELFIELWEKRETLEVNKSFEVYIFTALKYKVLNWKRGEMVKARHLNNLEKTKPYYHNSLEENIDARELNQILEDEISRLPEQCRLVYQLSRRDNLSIPEIAENLNIAESTVEKHLVKALKFLRANLQDYITVFVIFVASLIRGLI